MDNENIKRGEELANEGRYQEAYDIFLKESQLGNPKGSHDIGVMYEDGIGFDKNIDEALKWFEKAANKGYIDGMLKMRYYAYIKGDYKQCHFWGLKAAEAGDTQSMIDVASHYFTGQGVEKNDEKGYRWILTSANLGKKEAQYILSMLYRDGLGTEVNLSRASFYAKKAYAQGMEEAKTDVLDQLPKEYQ